jgi:creatinine amidohydrolase/Fe(II)-dependent formamide hydrolase-like protein
MRERALAHLALPAIREHVERSGRVLVPVGSTEQHGDHAPYGTDALIAEAVCDRIAPRVDALVAPTIAVGTSPEHEGWPGVVSFSPSFFIAFVRETCLALAHAGFRWIVLVNGHMTNVIGLRAAVIEASGALPRSTTVYCVDYWEGFSEEARSRYIGPEAGLHANIGETSAVLAIDESLVDLGRARPGGPVAPPSPEQALVTYLFSRPGSYFRAVPGGTWGDPTASTAALGSEFFAQIEEGLVALLAETDRVVGALEGEEPPA